VSIGEPATDPTERPLLDPGEVAELLRQDGRWPAWPAARVHPLHGRIGERTARRLGSGMDFAEIRPYQAGDDPRHLQWRASARTGSLQVRRFHQDVSPSVCLLVDRSAGMRFGTRRRLKATQAARLALVLGAQEIRQGSELCALVREPERRWLPRAFGPTALRRLAAGVTAPAPPLPPGDEDWSVVFGELTARLTAGSRVYLISDFHGLRDADRLLLADLGRRFEVRALVVYDAAERRLPAAGPLLLRWGGSATPADGRDRSQRARHADAWRNHCARLQEAFGAAGITARFVPAAADDLAAALARAGDGA